MGQFISIKKPEGNQGGGLFKHANKAPQQDVSEDITNLNRRVRILEEKNTNMQNRMEVIEQNMIHRHKRLSTEIKTTITDIHELKKETNELKERMLMMIKELQMSAKREEVAILKKYIDAWEPVNFVTHNEVDELIEEKLNQKS
ncbi:MAG: hypothetical protein ABIC04_07955 [Nanoarchaeota archaeon]